MPALDSGQPDQPNDAHHPVPHARGRSTVRIVFILLPPSETKAPGGVLPALDVGSLLFPTLGPTREALLTALSRLAANPAAARAALGVGTARDQEIQANAVLRSSATMPALRRYTGVLYDALAVGDMTPAERSRAESRVLVCSALFGMLRATDRIPAYRFSAGSRLPGAGTVAARWRPALGPLLAGLSGPVMELRSGADAAFADAPGAITVRVVTERPDGTRSIVSHWSKAAKGRLARALASSRARLDDVTDIARVARRAGLSIERIGEAALQIIT